MSAVSEELLQDLHRCIDLEDPEWLRLLLDSGADVNGGAGIRRTPLMHAASRGRVELVRLFLERGAEVNGRGADGKTALMAAASRGRSEVAALLIAHGAEVNARAANGWTALMHTIGSDPEVAKLLIQAGAEVDARADDGSTALTLASSWSPPGPLVELLMEAGAELPVTAQPFAETDDDSSAEMDSSVP